MLGKIIYNEQEQSGNYKWLGIPSYMTANFKSTFGDYAEIIAAVAVRMILEKHPNDADYFQTFRYVWPDGKKTKFWIINDVTHYTALLPSDY